MSLKIYAFWPIHFGFPKGWFSSRATNVTLNLKFMIMENASLQQINNWNLCLESKCSLFVCIMFKNFNWVYMATGHVISKFHNFNSHSMMAIVQFVLILWNICCCYIYTYARYNIKENQQQIFLFRIIYAPACRHIWKAVFVHVAYIIPMLAHVYISFILFSLW